ncbi:uncharacterized protein LOC125468187 [Pyrus x bretschneideri]|uniref:uncharacterized protein LOC125468187 n=1 Tax=Pyrus x bretschneideri TaxID=225117 RepID=UPI00202E4A08|nr:uncharacterized protein LOC125468187 [Pyrus x bretschneideri]XP_048420087.1 uncharacterized protein LOC125468187 [Pyrus x bretschneideri]
MEKEGGRQRKSDRERERERGRGRSRDLIAIAADPRFHEWERGDSQRKAWGPSGFEGGVGIVARGLGLSLWTVSDSTTALKHCLVVERSPPLTQSSASSLIHGWLIYKKPSRINLGTGRKTRIWTLDVLSFVHHASSCPHSQVSSKLFNFFAQALKHLRSLTHPSIIDTPKIDEHVQREIMNHRSLKHPNIIRSKEMQMDEHVQREIINHKSLKNPNII